MVFFLSFNNAQRDIAKEFEKSLRDVKGPVYNYKNQKKKGDEGDVRREISHNLAQSQVMLSFLHDRYLDSNICQIEFLIFRELRPDTKRQIVIDLQDLFTEAPNKVSIKDLPRALSEDDEIAEAWIRTIIEYIIDRKLIRTDYFLNSSKKKKKKELDQMRIKVANLEKSIKNDLSKYRKKEYPSSEGKFRFVHGERGDCSGHFHFSLRSEYEKIKRACDTLGAFGVGATCFNPTLQDVDVYQRMGGDPIKQFEEFCGKECGKHIIILPDQEQFPGKWLRRKFGLKGRHIDAVNNTYIFAENLSEEIKKNIHRALEDSPIKCRDENIIAINKINEQNILCAVSDCLGVIERKIIS